jgi:hypothetical protein
MSRDQRGLALFGRLPGVLTLLGTPFEFLQVDVGADRFLDLARDLGMILEPAVERGAGLRLEVRSIVRARVRFGLRVPPSYRPDRDEDAGPST